MKATALPLAAQTPRARRRALRELVGGGEPWGAVALLLTDTVAAIGFAGGLAWAISALVAGGAFVPGVALTIAAGLVRALTVAAAADLGARAARTVKLTLRRRLVAQLFRTPPGSSRGSGERVHAAVDEVEALDGYVARFLPARHAAALAPVIVVAATAFASPVAAAILAATLIPFIVALALAGGAAADESRKQFAALSRLSALLGDRVRALPLILAFRAEEREAARVGDAAAEAAKRTLRVLRVAFLSTGALEFFAALSVALVAVYAGFNLLGLLPFPVPEQLSLAQAFFVLALAPDFYAPMRRLAATYHDRQMAETACERLAMPDAPGLPERAAPPLACPTAPAIAFRDLTIRYPDAPRDAVRGFALDIAPGQCVALTGRSGSGKSSILNVLLGLAPISRGSVLIDGQKLPDDADLTQHIAWAGQSPLILPGSIAYNIGLAMPGADRAQIAAAAETAGLAPMLMRREGGLDAELDARGSGLSGGERRRIGLARALLKPAPILLLDEPTAHLDPEGERALVTHIAEAVRRRTTLIATHSELLTAIADRVVSLEAAE